MTTRHINAKIYCCLLIMLISDDLAFADKSNN